jgi:hypothetical protein
MVPGRAADRLRHLARPDVEAAPRPGGRRTVTEGNARLRFRIPDGRQEVVHSFEGFRRLGRRLGQWVDHAPDGSILTVRDTSLDEIFALELEAP